MPYVPESRNPCRLPLPHSPKAAFTGPTQASGATPLQVKHSHHREAYQGEILLSFVLKEVPLKPERILLQVALLMGGLAAQNVGIGTNAPTQRSHVAGNLRSDSAFMPGNQVGAVGPYPFRAGSRRGTSPVTQWHRGSHPHEHGTWQQPHLGPQPHLYLPHPEPQRRVRWRPHR